MLCAYYSRCCDSRELFADLEISGDASFERNLNQYDVIYLDITLFLSTLKQGDMLVAQMQQEIINDLAQFYPELEKEHRLVDALCRMNQILDKKYVRVLKDYHGTVLLVGINYDEKSKTHGCVIREIEV